MASKQLTLGNFFRGAEGAAVVRERNVRKDQEENKKAYERKRKRGFIEAWRDEFQGLTDTPEGMICTDCSRFRETAGQTSFLTGNTYYRIDNIRSHFSSPKHIQCAQAVRAIENQHVQGPMDIIIQKLGEQNKTLLCYMFNTAYCVIHGEMPFTYYPTLMNLQTKNGSDLFRLQSYQTNKACSRY